jgi:hypothetical protein
MPQPDFRALAERTVHELRNALVPALLRAKRDGRADDVEALERGCEAARVLADALRESEPATDPLPPMALAKEP